MTIEHIALTALGICVALLIISVIRLNDVIAKKDLAITKWRNQIDLLKVKATDAEARRTNAEHKLLIAEADVRILTKENAKLKNRVQIASPRDFLSEYEAAKKN